MTTLAIPLIDSAHASWFSNASVRRGNGGWFDAPFAAFDWRFPVEMKALLGHPDFLRQPESIRQFVNVQCFHKYLQDVCLTETEVVNRVATDLAYGRAAAQLSPSMAAEAFAVIVDEGFHSYVARLFSLRIQEATGIEPVLLPKRNPLISACEDDSPDADLQERAMRDLLCCCLSESTFTKEILMASKLEGYDERFNALMVAHLSDEGRHYGFFRRVLEQYWAQLPPTGRKAAAHMLPGILQRYFSDEIDTLFDRHVLAAAGVAAQDVQRWIEETNAESPPLAHHPRVRNSLDLLSRCGLLSDTLVAQRLRETGLTT